MRPTVLIVAKAPVPGRSKTRLVPPLTAEEAAALQEALLLDTLAACRREVPGTGVLYDEPEDAPHLRRLVGDETRLVLQSGRGLGDALRGAIAAHARDGPVALVSGDVPGLPEGAVGRAFEALDAGADVVLGPAADGGYWLIAMREAHDEPFREIPWSTPSVLALTLERCSHAGLEVALLERWRDIDTPVDLAELARLDGAADAPRTTSLIRRLKRERVPLDVPSVELVASELLSGTPWRAVLRDRLVTDGDETTYTYLATPRAVFVVPVTDAGEVVLVRQYRHPVRDVPLEVPAGSVEEGESSLAAAQRELAEEVGGRARAWTHLTTFYSSSAHVSLRSDAWLATGVELAAPRPGRDKRMTVLRLPLAEALARARAGLFEEGQTALALLLAAEHLDPRHETS
jgi:rSAM/selenodomain-associated transferase 1